MAETGTEAGTGAGWHRRRLTARSCTTRGHRNPRVQLNNRCAHLEEGGTQICSGQWREGRKTSHAFKRRLEFNLINCEPVLFHFGRRVFRLMTVSASQKTISCNVLEESTPFYPPFRYAGANPAGRLGSLVCRTLFQRACFQSAK